MRPNIASIENPNYKHGFKKHPLYAVWCTMKQRCYNPRSKDFKHYGLRDVKICDEWKNDPASFINWALVNGYKKGLTIDRIDNDGNYEHGNVRFVGRTLQSQNRNYTTLDIGKSEKIRDLYKKGNISQDKIALAFNVSQSTISRVLRNESWGSSCH